MRKHCCAAGVRVRARCCAVMGCRATPALPWRPRARLSPPVWCPHMYAHGLTSRATQNAQALGMVGYSSPVRRLTVARRRVASACTHTALAVRRAAPYTCVVRLAQAHMLGTLVTLVRRNDGAVPHAMAVVSDHAGVAAARVPTCGRPKCDVSHTSVCAARRTVAIVRLAGPSTPSMR